MKPTPHKLNKKKLLKEAADRIFTLGLNDLASVLAYKNMCYGLGKVMYALDSFDVCCVFGPDATITRNVGRWESGFSYGAVVRWPDSGIFFPEMKPNACGMLLAEVDDIPPRDVLVERLFMLEESGLSLDGVSIKPDFGHGNHFLEFYSLLNCSSEAEDLFNNDCYYVLLHCSAPEKKDQLYGGLDLCRKVETPLGFISVLEDGAGVEYYRRWKELEDFSCRRRELLLDELLGDYKIISNVIHQGLFEVNELRLGCYNTINRSSDGRDLFFPVALRWDAPLYVFKGRKNLSDELISRLGFRDRSERLGLLDVLSDINILPHGGGYKVEVEYKHVDVVDLNGRRVFILEGVKDAGKSRMVVMNPRELPYDYRGTSVVEKTIEYGLGNPVARLQPLMTLKI